MLLSITIAPDRHVFGFASHKRESVRRSLAVGLLAFAAGCFWRGPEILTPVRIESARMPTSGVESPPVTHSVANVGDDPFRRIDRLEWPGPNQYRTATGAPGPDYWQQRADYTIVATLDTTARTVRGTVSIRYTNNSPDTLRFVWLQLDQNLYRPGSKGASLFNSESRWGVRGFRGGYDITGLQINGRGVAGRVDDTMMRIDLDTSSAKIVNAGHPFPLRLRDGRVEEIELDIDFPFGIRSGRSFRVQEFPIAPGDRIIFVTDGMLERNAAEVDVPDALSRSGDLHPREVVHALGDAVMRATGGKLRDDATVVCLDWYGGPPRLRVSTGGASEHHAST